MVITEALLLKILAFIGKGVASAAMGRTIGYAFDSLYRWFFRIRGKSDELHGIWFGVVKQTSGSGAGEYNLLMRLKKTSGTSLQGRGLLWPNSEGNNPKLKNIAELQLSAIVQHLYLRIDFRNGNENKVQFGSILAKISGQLNNIEGQFAAISITDQMPVGGTLVLDKQEQMPIINYIK